MSEHYRKKCTVIFRLRNSQPFIIGRTPCPLFLPSMQIGEHLSSNLPRRKATHDCKSDATFEFIQCLMRKATTSRRSNAALREFQLIALTDAPLFERILRQNY